MPMSDLYSTHSKYLEFKFLSKSDEFLLLGPICSNIDFRYKLWKYKLYICTLQID